MNRVTQLQLNQTLNTELRYRRINVDQADWIKKMASDMNLSLLEVKALVKGVKGCGSGKNVQHKNRVRFISS